MDHYKAPSIEEIRAARKSLGEQIVTTPVWQWRGEAIQNLTSSDTEVFLKLELFQTTGTFKPRGALCTMRALSAENLERGVVAVSAGNHAAAVAYAAKIFGTSAKVVMPTNANPARVERCKLYGADIVFVNSIHEAFETEKQLVEAEGRTSIHGYDGPLITLGTATVGLELMEQVPNLDAVVVAVGGGALLAGISCAVKQLNPKCAVYGVEPEGANTMGRSFSSGTLETIQSIDTIANSLGAPDTKPYGFSICSQFTDRIVTVSDDEIRSAMKLMFSEMKLACEPAAAAATAGAIGPLKADIVGKKVALVVCGSNIDISTFARHIEGVTA